MFIGQRAAQELDVVLMSIEHGFSIDQLMELAGLSVAQSLFKAYGEGKKAIVICGPGNNGGDGLVASRHLKHFGWNPSILYPKSTTNELYLRLMKQCKQLEIPIYEQSIDFSSFDLIVDSIFGFGFKGNVREPFDGLLKMMKQSNIPIASIDVPSGWDVEKGNINDTIEPEMVVSLSFPKPCMQYFKGKHHFLGGRFIPPSIAKQFQMTLPKYFGSDQFVRLN